MLDNSRKGVFFRRKIMNDFSERLKNALLKRNILASDLANMTGVSRASISQYINGNRTPSPAMTKKIADALNVDYWWLIGSSDKTISYDDMPKVEIETPKANVFSQIPISQNRLSLETSIIEQFDSLSVDELQLLIYTIKSLKNPALKEKIFAYGKAIGVIPKDTLSSVG